MTTIRSRCRGVALAVPPASDVAALLDRAGRPVGAPQQLVVRSTRYGTVALAVTGLGAGVLFVAAGAVLSRIIGILRTSLSLTAGMLTGALLLAGIGALVIPGVGPLVAALVAALLARYLSDEEG